MHNTRVKNEENSFNVYRIAGDETAPVKGTIMKIEKALINHSLGVSNIS